MFQIGQSEKYVILNAGSAFVETHEQLSNLETNSDEPKIALFLWNDTDT